MKEYEPRRCEICGREYTPRRSDQRTCLGEECMKERQRLNQIEYRRTHYASVLESNRKALAKRRAEKRMKEAPIKEDTIVAIGYADRQREQTLRMVGKVRTEL